MGSVFAVCLPFFALVGLGWVAAGRAWLPLGATPGLNALVMLFALPALLFQMGRTWAHQGFEGLGLVPAYGLVGVSLVGVAFALARRAGLTGRDAGFASLIAAFPNTGFMGLPLLTGLMGAHDAAPVVATIVFDLVVTTSVCLVLAGGAPREGLGLALRNPLPWAVCAGLLAGAQGWTFPAPLEQVLNLLAQACTPVALITLGLVLAQQAQRSAAPIGAPPSPSMGLALAAIKVALHPVLAMGAAWAAQRAGWLGDSSAMVLVLASALPSAANVALLAQRLGADNAAVPRAVLLSTVAALFTVPLWAWGLGVQV